MWKMTYHHVWLHNALKSVTFLHISLCEILHVTMCNLHIIMCDVHNALQSLPLCLHNNMHKVPYQYDFGKSEVLKNTQARHTGTQAPRGTQAHRHTGTQAHRHAGTQAHGHTQHTQRAHRYAGTQTHKTHKTHKTHRHTDTQRQRGRVS